MKHTFKDHKRYTNCYYLLISKVCSLHKTCTEVPTTLKFTNLHEEPIWYFWRLKVKLLVDTSKKQIQSASLTLNSELDSQYNQHHG